MTMKIEMERVGFHAGYFMEADELIRFPGSDSS